MKMIHPTPPLEYSVLSYKTYVLDMLIIIGMKY